MIKNVVIVIIQAFKSKYHYFNIDESLYQKNTPQICLILREFNLYVLLICGKKIRDK